MSSKLPVLLVLLLATSGCFTQLGQTPNQRTERSKAEEVETKRPADSRLFATTSAEGFLRAGPNAEAFVLAEVDPGVRVEILGTDGAYFYVRYRARSGYLLRSSVEAKAEAETLANSASERVAGDKRPSRRTKEPRKSNRRSRASSNQRGLTFGAGGGTAIFDSRKKGFGALNSGFVLRRARFIATAEAEVDVTSSDDEGNPRYYWDSSVDRCRDSANGQFARSGLCGSNAMDFFLAATADANFAVGIGSYAGLGVRVGEAATPYISLGYVGSPSDGYPMRLSAGFWTDYVSLAIRFYAPF